LGERLPPPEPWKLAVTVIGPVITTVVEAELGEATGPAHPLNAYPRVPAAASGTVEPALKNPVAGLTLPVPKGVTCVVNRYCCTP